MKTAITEMFGIDVRALGDGLTRSEVEEVLDEVLARMEAHSGCKGYIVDLDAAGGRPVALP